MLLNMPSTWTYIAVLATLGLQVLADPYEGRNCGFKIAPCREDMTCVPYDPDCTDLNVCGGTCQFTNKYPRCGTRGPTGPVGTCRKGSKCGDDPRTPDSCGLACDIPGICIPKKAPQCNGFAGFQCPKGLFCYDVPNDGCDPNNGGADCIGICL